MAKRFKIMFWMFLICGICMIFIFFSLRKREYVSSYPETPTSSFVCGDINGNWGVLSYAGDGESAVYIPKEVDGKEVKVIGEYAFSFDNEIETIYLPESVEEISEDAFYYCENLKEVHGQGGIRIIGDDCFYGTQITVADGIFDNVTTLGSLNGSSLEKLSLKNVKVISDGALQNQNTLTAITFPKSLKKVPSMCCMWDSSLTKVCIKNGCESIGELAFGYCVSLKDVYIPDSVHYISESAFLGVDNFTIHGKKGSYAQEYANDNSITFK